MNLHQLRCFVVAADELHFGRAAQKLEILPSAFGRFIRLLEDDLGVQLFERTTRNVVLTPEGRILLGDARKLMAQADAMRARFREGVRSQATKLRIGAIDSAAVGLIPMLLRDFRRTTAVGEVQVLEDKTIRLIPRLLSGRLDVAFIRPPKSRVPTLVYRHLFHETPVVALPAGHPLARRRKIAVGEIADEALIAPDRRSRPHSHDLAIKLFQEAGVEPRITQIADDKQTIVNLVAEGLGVAIVPRWTSSMRVGGVAYVPLALDKTTLTGRLPLAAVWPRDTKDVLRDTLLGVLKDNLDRYAVKAYRPLSGILIAEVEEVGRLASVRTAERPVGQRPAVPRRSYSLPSALSAEGVRVMGQAQFDPGARERGAWKAGRMVGAKRALTPRQVWAIRFFLDQGCRCRDRALVDLAIDGKLRAATS